MIRWDEICLDLGRSTELGNQLGAKWRLGASSSLIVYEQENRRIWDPAFIPEMYHVYEKHWQTL